MSLASLPDILAAVLAGLFVVLVLFGTTRL